MNQTENTTSVSRNLFHKSLIYVKYTMWQVLSALRKANGGDMMLKRKQALIGIGILGWVIAVSVSFLYVFAPSPWTTQDMVDYMYNVGKHKIWQTNWILYNEIHPKVDDIDEKMGQGLVGEWDKDSIDTILHLEKPIWFYETPTNNPKKVSFWVSLRNMRDGDSLTIWVRYDVDGDFADNPQDTLTRKWSWHFTDEQKSPPGFVVLIVDELPVATILSINYYQSAGIPFTIDYQYIIEEL